MLINVPRPSSNGSLFKNQVLSGKKSATRYSTYDQALAGLGVMTYTQSQLAEYASRGNMQKGVIGFRRYKNTPYVASYIEQNSTGVNRMISKYVATVPYESIVAPLGFQDASGQVLSVINPPPFRLFFTGDQGNHPIGVINRAVIQNTVNRAQAEARQRAIDQKIDLSETLVDLDKSALMVADGTIRVLKALAAVKRGNIGSALRYLGIDRRKPPKYKDIANAWLALQYGWLPLINDVFDGYSAIQTILDPEANPHQLHATRRIHQPLVMPPSWNVLGEHEVLKNEAECSVEAKYRFSVSDPFWALMGQLGLTNPASFAWAALPYSFVVDWLLPVGTMLSALSAPVGLKFQSGYTTTRMWGEVEIRRTKLPQYGEVVFNDGISRVKSRAGKIERVVHTNWPSVLPYVRLPFSNPTRLLNAAALIETSKRRG